MTLVLYTMYVISWAVFIYFAASTLYLLFMAICGRLLRGKKYEVRKEKLTIAVLIPSFRDDRVIVDTAIQASQHNYPPSKLSITVIADKLRPETIRELMDIPVDVLEVDLSMKSRSLHAAFRSSRVADSDIVMILDADNVMAPGCLEKVNGAFEAGCEAVQCHRTAKNMNTPVALLDAMSEEVNIHLFRRGPAAAGLSVQPLGSGMAFRTGLINEILSVPSILENPGEDREIDMQLLQRRIKMVFLDDALVYDEKVALASVFEKQRVRWLEAQLNHAGRFFDGDMKKARHSIVFYYKFFQILLLPRVLTIVVFFFTGLVLLLQTIFRVPLLEPRPAVWLTMMGLYFLTLFISIPLRFYRLKTLRALIHLPVLMFSMMRAVSQMKKKRREFIHTPKSFISED